MLTPQEVSGKAFPKASFGGYSMSSVDEFLDALTEDYTALYKENATLKAKLKVLAEKVEEYRATEDAMRSTLLTAQRMAAQMVQDAQAQKDEMLASARQEAATQIGQLELETEQARQKLALAQQELAAFVQHSQELCAAQAAFLQQLPEMQLTKAAPEPEVQPVVEEPVVETAQPAQPVQPEPEPVQAPAAQPVEEPAAAQEPAQPAREEEEDPFPVDFKLNLDELKFGRNYTGQ